MTVTLKLPGKHAEDWAGRCDWDEHTFTVEVTASTARTVTLTLSETALRDLISDALYYSTEMGPDATGDTDYRPAARACLRGLERAGITWTLHGHTVQLGPGHAGNPER